MLISFLIAVHAPQAIASTSSMDGHRAMALRRAPFGSNWLSTKDLSPCCVIQHSGEGIP
jgi:hypothetical protein